MLGSCPTPINEAKEEDTAPKYLVHILFMRDTTFLDTAFPQRTTAMTFASGTNKIPPFNRPLYDHATIYSLDDINFLYIILISRLTILHIQSLPFGGFTHFVRSSGDELMASLLMAVR